MIKISNQQLISSIITERGTAVGADGKSELYFSVDGEDKERLCSRVMEKGERQRNRVSERRSGKQGDRREREREKDRRD